MKQYGSPYLIFSLLTNNIAFSDIYDNLKETKKRILIKGKQNCFVFK